MACVCVPPLWAVAGRWWSLARPALAAGVWCVACRGRRHAGAGPPEFSHMTCTCTCNHAGDAWRAACASLSLNVSNEHDAKSGRKVDSAGRQIARPARSQQAHTALDRSYTTSRTGKILEAHTKTLTERYRSGWSRQRDLPPPPHNRFHGLRTPRTRAPPQATTPRRRPGEWEQR